MLSFEETQRLRALKAQLSKKLGIVGTELSDDQWKGIFQEIEKHPLKDRTVPLWQGVVKAKIGIREFGLFEALDVSDTDYIHKQIQDLLDKK